MKNQLMKFKKSEGYIGIETMIIACLVIAAGFVALSTVMADLESNAIGVNGDITGAAMNAFVVL